MSDSRSILLKLSVRDADVVRRELESMGATGAAALARLDAAAKTAAGTGSGATGGGFSGFRNAVGQAGFQLQDFAVQVQGGTSALTALSQQGSQFLGIFGAGGAIAGAVLTVGILAARFLDLGGATERAEAAEKKYAEAVARSNGFLLTAIQRTNQLTNARRVTEVENVGEALDALRGELRGNIDRQQTLRGTNDPLDAGAFNLSQLTQETRRTLATLEAQEGLLRGRIAELEGRMTQTAEGASGEERDQAENLRRTLDDRYRIRAEYEARVVELRQLASRGLFSQAERERAEADAAKKRDEELAALARRAAGGSGTTAGTPQSLAATMDRLRNQVESGRERGREQFSSIMGTVSPRDNALEDYARRQRQLTELADNNVISEQEFTEAVERTTVALGRQLEEIDKRANGASDVSRQLGLTFSSAFEDAISKGKSFRDVLSGIAEDLAKLVIRKSITEPVGNALSGALSGVNLSSIGTGIVNFLGFGGPRAGGGPVMAGTTYLVGERGPELFTAPANGNIIPNGAMGGAAFSPTYNIDARGSDPSMIPRLRAEMSAIAQASVADFARAIERGGSAARLVGRR